MKSVYFSFKITSKCSWVMPSAHGPIFCQIQTVSAHTIWFLSHTKNGTYLMIHLAHTHQLIIRVIVLWPKQAKTQCWITPIQFVYLTFLSQTNIRIKGSIFLSDQKLAHMIGFSRRYLVYDKKIVLCALSISKPDLLLGFHGGCHVLDGHLRFLAGFHGTSHLISDVVGLGLVKSLPPPYGTITGVPPALSATYWMMTESRRVGRWYCKLRRTTKLC